MSFSRVDVDVDVPTTTKMLASKEAFYETLIPLISAISKRLAGVVNLEEAYKKLAKEVYTPIFKKKHDNDRVRSTRQSEFSRKVFMLFSYCEREHVPVAELGTEQIDDILIAENFSWENDEGQSFFSTQYIVTFYCNNNLSHNLF